MKRYHLKIFVKPEHLTMIEDLTTLLNNKEWSYTAHCLDNLKHRIIDIEAVLLFIKNIELKPKQVFEFYEDNGVIEKLCYRIEFKKDIDLILVINKDKKIITIYMNSSEDLHYTLKPELYQRG